MSRQLIQRIKAMLLYMQYTLNAMFVETVNTTVKTHPHIPAHNFLNIQQIFNPQKVLES